MQDFKNGLSRCLSKWKEGINYDKKSFVDIIFKEVDSGNLSKLDAIRFISIYKLLPIAQFYQEITFMEEYFNNRNDRYKIIDYYEDVLLDPTNFINSETGVAVDYANFPDITFTDAIDEIYTCVKEKRIIGFINDW